MTARPNPQPWPGVLSMLDVAERKRLDCRSYVRCMDAAAAAGWPQFHCGECSAHTPSHPKDRLALLRLRHAVAAGAEPAGKSRARATSRSAPALDQPAPALDQPAPALDQPAPALDQPAPALDQPAPTTEEDHHD